jgi:hypothetical protein
MHFQLTALGMPELSRLFYRLLTLRALKPFWMKMLEDPFNAIFIVKQFCDWKFHASSLPLYRTSFTHEPNIYSQIKTSLEPVMHFGGW